MSGLVYILYRNFVLQLWIKLFH